MHGEGALRRKAQVHHWLHVPDDTHRHGSTAGGIKLSWTLILTKCVVGQQRKRPSPKREVRAMRRNHWARSSERAQ